MIWIAVHTKPSEEFTAEFHLRRYGLETWLPWVYVARRREIRRSNRRIKVVVGHDKQPFFSRYLFAKIDPKLHVRRVNHTVGVLKIVGIGEDPLVIPDDVMRELFAAAKVDGEVVDEAERPDPKAVVIGDQVRVPVHDSYGRLVQNLIAEVVGIDRTGKIRIWSDSFRRPWTVERARVELDGPVGGSVETRAR